MASNQDEGSVRSNDDTISSLGDSAYDFIDDTSFATIDDEDQSKMTDSVSVTGRSVLEDPESNDMERTLSADDVQSLLSKDSKKDIVQDAVTGSTSRKEVDSPGYNSLTPQQLETEQPLPSGMRNIRFEAIYHDEGTYPLETSSVPQNLSVTVRQHMVDQTLSSGGSYRVLYIGNPAARERIMTKVGAALASTTKLEASGPSRYSVVPIPSSNDPSCWGEPVLLDWSGHEIVVYHCVDASFGRTENGHDSIDLTMEDNTHIRSSWDVTEYSVSGDWEFPDVAIFYISDHDNVSARQTRRFARSFMARHKVPSILISERPCWDRPSEAMTIDHLTPHICLQATKDTTSSSRVVKRLPIDISTFLRIDALQLNRNLAYLNTQSEARRIREPGLLHPKSEGINDSGKEHVSSLRHSISTPSVFRKFLNTTSPFLPYLFDALATAAICMAVGLVVIQTPLISSRYIKTGASFHSAGGTTATVTSSPVALSTTLSQGRPTMTESLTVPGQVKANIPQRTTGEKSQTDLATLWLDSSPKTANKSENFKVHVLGNKHIILQPPHWFTKLRKTPKLMFNVTQGGRILKHEVSTLFDGVYALGLPEADAHGLVNISVWTGSNPKIQEKLQANFGNSWLQAADWRNAASALSGSFQQELGMMQTALGNLYIRSSAELHSLAQRTKAKAAVIKHETQDISEASVSQVAKMKETVSAFRADIISSLSRAFYEKQSAAAKRMSLRTTHVRRNISSYVSNKIHLGQSYVRAAPTAYRIHLRETQKRALKLWWNMAGLPERRPVSIRVRGKSRNTSGKQGKQHISK
ncbi:MAG: hypothetical protein L6R41_001147 [Letrouitia leprolyta]|nr:MAG: hypothetical protein L6R41_001147 [Letrouitia leprolyta]